MVMKHLAASCATALLLCAGASDAEAQGFWSYWSEGSIRPPGYARPRRPADPSRLLKRSDRDSDTVAPGSAATVGKGARPPAAVGTLVAVVSLAEQRVSIYGPGGLIVRSPISSGTRSNPTPTGVFSIIQKNRYHRSNLYSNAPMPFMQRITWSGVAMHAGVLPGYPASHGCIRLPYSFAAQLWGMTRMGARVIVARADVTPVDISHPFLFTPRMLPAAPAVAQASQPSPTLVTLAQADRGGETPASAAAALTQPRLLNPIEAAEAQRVGATAKAAELEKAEKKAFSLAAEQSSEARKARIALRKAELAVTAAESKLASAERAVQNAKTEDATQSAEAAKSATEATLAEARKAQDDALALEASESREAADAVAAAREAQAATNAAEAAAKDAARRTKPLTVFISGKDRRLYVRQNLEPVFDVPVTIRDGDKALGTHVFTAMQPAEDGHLRWSVVSLPASLPPEPRKKVSAKSGDRADTRSERPAAPVTGETASGALDRIVLPPELVERFSGMVWTGATIMVSDLGPGNETGLGTDIILQTRH